MSEQDLNRENRESFMARLRPILPPSIMLDVEVAYTLAKFSHRAQTRKEMGPDGNPLRYFEHVRRVAISVIVEAKCPIREMVCAALLHDGIEDTRDLTPAMIEHVFGLDVTAIVMALSKTPKEGYLERLMTCTDWRPYVIKACDRLDNLRSLSGGSMEFQRKQVKETKDHYYPLFDRMVGLVPSEYKAGAQSLRDKVFGLNERLELSVSGT